MREQAEAVALGAMREPSSELFLKVCMEPGGYEASGRMFRKVEEAHAVREE